MACSRWKSEFPFVPDKHVTEAQAARNKPYCPLKKIIGLDSLRITAKRPMSTTESS